MILNRQQKKVGDPLLLFPGWQGFSRFGKERTRPSAGDSPFLATGNKHSLFLQA